MISSKDEKSSSEQTKITIKNRNEFLKAPRNYNLRVKLTQPLGGNKTLSMLIAKSSHALSLFWP
jgi:hypothetical protein